MQFFTNILQKFKGIYEKKIKITGVLDYGPLFSRFVLRF